MVIDNPHSLNILTIYFFFLSTSRLKILGKTPKPSSRYKHILYIYYIDMYYIYIILYINIYIIYIHIYIYTYIYIYIYIIYIYIYYILQLPSTRPNWKIDNASDKSTRLIMNHEHVLPMKHYFTKCVSMNVSFGLNDIQ